MEEKVKYGRYKTAFICLPSPLLRPDLFLFLLITVRKSMSALYR